jgi:hypothetical protein
MEAKVGDTIVIETEHVGDVAREGEILELLESDLGIGYRVRWRDGHESVLRPAAGSVRVISSGN